MATSVCRSLHGQQCLYKCKPWITSLSFIFRQYHAVTLNTINTCCHSGTFWKSHERTNRLTKNCFSNKPHIRVSVVASRGPLKWISNKFKLFLVNSYFDADFDEDTFLEGAKQVPMHLCNCV